MTTGANSKKLSKFNVFYKAASYSKKSFTVLVPGPSHALPPGWFVVDPGTGNDVSGSSGLLGNVPVNGLDEWDLNKLGWFKFRQSAQDHDGGGADQGLML